MHAMACLRWNGDGIIILARQIIDDVVKRADIWAYGPVGACVDMAKCIVG